MDSEIIQVRDVPAEDTKVLRERAAARNMSLSAYLRELIHDDASRPTMAEAMARIDTHEPIEATPEEIRSFIEDGRR
jgi:plasmid stability protein